MSSGPQDARVMPDDFSLEGATVELNGESFEIGTYEARPNESGKGIDMTITCACGRVFEITGAQMVSNRLVDEEHVCDDEVTS